jgi:hypothetical protein
VLLGADIRIRWIGRVRRRSAFSLGDAHKLSPQR